MIEDITFVIQIVTLALLGWTTWSIWKSGKRIKRQTTMIEQYRREIHWLTERVEQLEHRPPGVVKFK